MLPRTNPTARGVIYLFNYLFREARIHAGVALPVGELPSTVAPTSYDFGVSSTLRQPGDSAAFVE